MARVDAFAHEKLAININCGLTGERTRRNGTFSEMLNTDYGRGKPAKTQSSIFRKNQRYSKVDASSPYYDGIVSNGSVAYLRY